MEFFYEAIVMNFLTTGDKRFCCPQFVIKGDRGGEWRCPDFVVLDFELPQRIIVAEVTAAADIKPLALKTAEMIEEGFPKLRQQLVGTLGPHIAEWTMIVQLFVREDRKDAMVRALQGYGRYVEVLALEETFQRWKPDFGKRLMQETAV